MYSQDKSDDAFKILNPRTSPEYLFLKVFVFKNSTSNMRIDSRKNPRKIFDPLFWKFKAFKLLLWSLLWNCHPPLI